MLALTETKLEGEGEVSWSGVNVIFAGVQEMERAREGVTVLLNNVWHSAVVKCEYISSKILWYNSSIGTTWTGLWIVY